jgi:hypothetical protein
MSTTSDVRSYADSALEQAQARLTEVRGDATEFAGTVLSRAVMTYTELRTRGEALTKRVGAIPAVERANATFEPYVAQLKDYGGGAVEKLEQVYAELRKNEQVAKVIAVAETAIDAVQERVTSLLDGRSMAPGEAAAKTTPAPKAEPAAKASAAPKAEPAAKTTPAPKAEPVAKARAAKATPAKRTTSRRATEA